jgi:hypothetical protein
VQPYDIISKVIHIGLKEGTVSIRQVTTVMQMKCKALAHQRGEVS